MTKSFTGRKRIRKDFGRIREVAPMPNLIEVQKSSYDSFLQINESAEDRIDHGLQEVFKSVFPIKDFSEHGTLEFVKYELEPPKYDVDECQQRGMTFAAPLKVTLRLVVFDIDDETGARSIRDIKEQDVYMGDMPLMVAGRFLRSRQGQDPFVGQVLVCGPRHSLPGIVARFRIRRQGSGVRAHRSPPQAAGDDAFVGARFRRYRTSSGGVGGGGRGAGA